MASITLNGNVASWDAQRRLAQSTGSLSRSFERLSSGLRINKASDDAAGLSIAASLRADSRVFGQGVRNVNDGISLLNIADSSLEQLSNIVTRLRELATEGENGTFSNRQRESLDKEAQSLAKEFNRIARTTSFNGVHLFDATNSDLSLQAGYSQLTYNLGGAIGDASFGARQVYTTGPSPSGVSVADFNGDGISDFITGNYGTGGTGTTLSVFLGKGDGTFVTGQSFTTGPGPQGFGVADFNGDGALDVVTSDSAGGSGSTASVLLGNGDGTFKARQVFTTGAIPTDVAVGDFNGDGMSDFVTADQQSNAVSVFLGKGNGAFQARQAFSAGPGASALTVADFNRDGVSDLAAADLHASTVTVLLGNGDGTFKAGQAFGTGANPFNIATGDFNGDGVPDLVTADFGNGSGSTVSVLLGNGDGTFRARQALTAGTAPTDVAVGDFDGDGALDILTTDYGSNTASVILGNGDGTFRTKQAFATGINPHDIALGDFNGDGVSDVVATDFNGNTGTTASVYIGNAEHGVGSLLPFSLLTRDDSRDAMSYLAQAQKRLSAQRGQIGAFQSRAGYVVSALAVTREETTAAESRITDADLAEESANLVKSQILQQAAAAVLAQANQGPALALLLLRTS